MGSRIKDGTMLWIERNVKKGDKVVIIEDVITTGLPFYIFIVDL